MEASDEVGRLRALGTRVAAQISHAARHGEELAAQIQAHEGLRHIKLVPVIAEDRLSWELRTSLSPLPIDDWGQRFAGGIHALRTTLDHLAWGLATLDGQEPQKPKRVQFPIVVDESDWKGERSRIAELPANAQLAIEQIQPFQRFESGAEGTPETDPLARLSELDNKAKHRMILLPLTTPQEIASSFTVEFRSAEDAAQVGVPDLHVDALALSEAGVLLRQVVPVPIVSIKGKLDLRVQVAVELEDGSVMGVTSGLGFLCTYVIGVVNHVLAAMSAEPGKAT